MPVLPWEQALQTPVDLAVTASFGGQLVPHAPLLTVPVGEVPQRRRQLRHRPGARFGERVTD
ncbi:hypothetical protein CCS38_11365 [Streptomyces purpurogeneiscleroticus]|nr:hypothetical protein [Streptomyces purpurogeneiscleroticus]